MASRPRSFRQADVSRALKGAIAAGLKPSKAEMTADGAIVLSFATENDATTAPDPFDAWRAKRDARSA